MKKVYILILCFCGCLTAFGQNDASFSPLKERVDAAIKAKNPDELFSVEKDFDAYFTDVSHRTPAVNFE